MVRCRRPLILASVVAVAACSLLTAGCGGGGSPGVASVASSTSAATTDGTTTTQNGTLASAFAFARCMRSHGITGLARPQQPGRSSTSPSCGHSGSTCPGSGRSRRVPATSRSRATRGTRSPLPIGLTTSGPPHACARTGSLTSPIRRSRATTSGSTSRRASTGHSPVHERGDDLHEVDPAGLPYSHRSAR